MDFRETRGHFQRDPTEDKARVNKALLNENWRLQVRLAAAEEEAAALRAACRYLRDSAAFVAEKMRLEDVLSSMLAEVAGQRATAVEMSSRAAAMAEASAQRLTEAESAATDAAEALAHAKTMLAELDAMPNRPNIPLFTPSSTV
jgi:hypothetical protein